MSYAVAQLDEAIRLAKALGFQDDVAYWEAEKRELAAHPEQEVMEP